MKVTVKSVVGGLVVALAVGAAPSAAVSVDSLAMPTYKRYSSCAKLQKDYPRGIAHSKIRVSKNSKYVWAKVNGKKVKYRPSLISDKAYNQQSRVRDRDRDFVACEKAGY